MAVDTYISVPRPTTIASRSELLHDARAIMREDYAEDLSLDDVAGRIATSRRQLQRVFHEIAGTGFREELAAIRMERAAELLARFPARNGTPQADPAPEFERRVRVERRDTQQSHLRLHWRPGIDPSDLRQRAALGVYSTLLGGSMGSRLFDEIREQRGLCYAIRSYGSSHADVPRLDISSGLDSTKCPEAYERIREIVADLAENGPRDGEVERARAYAAGRRVLAFENTNAVARHAAAQSIVFGETIDPDGAIAALDAVTIDEVAEVAREVADTLAVACVGPHTQADFG